MKRPRKPISVSLQNDLRYRRFQLTLDRRQFMPEGLRYRTAMTQFRAHISMLPVGGGAYKCGFRKKDVDDAVEMFWLLVDEKIGIDTPHLYRKTHTEFIDGGGHIPWMNVSLVPVHYHVFPNTWSGLGWRIAVSSMMASVMRKYR